jgi:hypothetical protein
VDDLGCDLVPEQASREDLGGGVTLILLAHSSKAFSKVAAVRRLGAWRERVAQVVTRHAVAGPGEVQRSHAVVLRRGDGEQLLSLLVLGGSSQVRVQLVKMRSRDASELRARHCGLGPSDTRWARFESGDMVCNEVVLSQGGRYTGILEDAVEHGGRCGADLFRHARDGRRSATRLACDECTAKQQHKQETRSDRLVLVLGARDDSKVLLVVLRGLLIRGEVVDEDVVVPVVAAHVEIVHLRGEVGEGGAGCDGHAVSGGSLKTLSEDGDLLAELTSLEGVVADELFLVELELVDHVVHVHGLAVPVLLLGDEGIILDAHAAKLLFHAAHLLDPVLFLFLELFSVLFLPLPGVKSVVMLASEQWGERIPNGCWDQTRNAEPRTKREYVRGLSVAEESFLLLELLEVVLVGAALDEVVDVEEIALGGDVEAGVLLPDATVTAGREGARRRRVGPHTLGSGPCIHLLLVESHPVGVRVWGHGLLGNRGCEDSAGPDVRVDGESMILHLLLGLSGELRSTKVTRSKGIQRFGGSRRPGAGVVGHWPRLLAIGSGLVWGKTCERVVALLSEEGVVAVCVDNGAGGGAVDELAGGEVFPDGGVWREDALRAGGGRHEHGRVQDVRVERRVVVKAEGGGFPVHVTQRR